MSPRAPYRPALVALGGVQSFAHKPSKVSLKEIISCRLKPDAQGFFIYLLSPAGLSGDPPDGINFFSSHLHSGDSPDNLKYDPQAIPASTQNP